MERLNKSARSTINKIEDEAFEFEFHQLLYLYSQYNQSVGASSYNLSVIPDTSLGFPAADIKSFTQVDGGYQLIVTFLGLYGVDSPLPQYFIEDIATEHESSLGLKAFLDIFNQRIYRLLHQGWLKGQFYRRGSNDNYGTITQHIQGHYWRQSDNYGGSSIGAQRNLVSLKNLILSSFPLDALEINRESISWKALDQNLSLGKNQQLGFDTLMGSDIAVSGTTLDFFLGEIKAGEAELFSPSQPMGLALSLLISQYLPTECSFTISMVMIPKADQMWCLGEHSPVMGCLGALGQSQNPIPIQFSQHQYNCNDCKHVA